MQEITIFLGQPNSREQSLFPDHLKFATFNKEGLFDSLKPYSLQICTGLNLYKCANFNNEKILNDVINEIDKIRQWAELNINSIKYNEKKYIKNLFDNLTTKPRYIKSLFNKFEKIPCVIVSAGSSLDKNINLLKNKKFLILSTPPVLNKLNKMNIDVDFLACITPNQATESHFKKITKFPPLIFDSGAYSSVIKNYSGVKYISIDNKPISNYLNNTLDVGNVPCGTCVSHYAYNLACAMGCEPIILIGQDLALTDNKSHATGAAFNEYEEGNLSIAGYYGREVKTTMLLKSYLDVFESILRNSKVKTYNCTEGGAHIEGAENKSLLELIIKLEEVNVLGFLKELQGVEDETARNSLINGFLDTTISKIKAFSDRIKHIIEYCNNVISLFENNKDYEAIELFKKAPNTQEILDAYPEIMESIKHLILSIYLRKPLNPKKITKALVDMDKEYLLKVTKESEQTFTTIFEALNYLALKYLKLRDKIDV